MSCLQQIEETDLVPIPDQPNDDLPISSGTLQQQSQSINSLQEKSIQSQGKPPATHDQILCTRSFGTQTAAVEDQTVKQPGENLPPRDFVNQLKSYKATQRDNFESLKPRHDERKI
ncbi:Hypothetical predicted protein [Paramuricea clavata]|uniref:Uncharacterized protein n=1 Tax=Paramuricea clavata TaxID=317549 RepID=A0A7D9HHV5_PARCT|nr:Hypothetical predicted protein [Paramuricea clavata]